MGNNFQCPPAFDIDAARVYLVAPMFKDDFAGRPDISVKALNGKQRPAYLSALGKVWKQMPLPCNIRFEEVAHNRNGAGNYLEHFHTEFYLAGYSIHVDFVHAWSYGPAAGQSCVKIYANGNLGASAILGGGFFGGNWHRRWPATVVIGGRLLRFTESLHHKKGSLLFKPDDDNSPISLYEAVPPEAVPFRVFDLTSDAFIDQRLIPALRTDAIDHVFYKGASNEDKKRFLTKLLDGGRGHFISDEALKEMVSLEIFSNCLGFLWEKCVFKEESGSIDSSDFDLNDYRTRELTNFCRELLLRFQSFQG